jgi:hypothetical protein
MATPTKEHLAELRAKLARRKEAYESGLLEIRSSGRSELTLGESEKYAHALADIEGLQAHCQEYASELERCGTVPEALQKRAIGQVR